LSDRPTPNSDARLDHDERRLIDAYFDRDLPAEEKPRLARLVASNAGAAMLFAGMQSAIDAMRQPVDTPDLSGAILDEVGRRRGWLGSRLQRFVSVGRLALAASLLLGLGMTLAVQRLAPDLGLFPSGPTPIAQVADCATSDVDCTVTDLRRAFTESTLTAGLGSMMVSSAPPTPVSASGSAGSSAAGLMAHPGGMGADPGVTSADIRCGAGVVRVFVLRSADPSPGPSILSIGDRARAGSVGFIVRRAPASTPAEPESKVEGW